MPGLTTRPFGEPAFAALVQTLHEIKRHDALTPVTVVVPSNYAGLSLRRRLGEAGNVINVRFLVLGRLCELLGAPRLSHERHPLTAWGRTEAIRSALAGHTGFLEHVAGHAAATTALAATFRELRPASEGIFGSLAQKSRRAAGVVALYRRFRRLTASAYDIEDLAESAAIAVSDGAQALQDLGHVVVYLPRPLSPGERALLRQLLERDATDVICGITFDPQADQWVHDLIREFEERASVSAFEGTPPVATGILRAIDVEEEVRSVIRLIIKEVEQGTPLYRIAVLFAAQDVYGNLLLEQFRAAEIPVNGPPVRMLAASMSGRLLLGLLKLPASGFRREAVMDWLTSGPIVETDQGAHTGRWVPAARWDEISRDGGVVQGLGQWEDRLTAWANRVPRREADAAHARRLAAFVADLGLRLQPPADLTMAGLGKWALGLLNRYLGSETAAAGWQNQAEADAYVQVRSHLREVAGTEPLQDPDIGTRVSVAPAGDAGAVCAFFTGVIDDLLAQPNGRLGRFGEGVFIAPFQTARGMSFERIFLLGMVEGSIPAAGREDPLLPDAERADAGLPQRQSRYADDRAEYLAALASAPERILCFPRSSLRAGAAYLPSRWLLESASACAGMAVASDRLAELASASWLTSIQSFQHALDVKSLPPASCQEWELRTLLHSPDPLDCFRELGPAFVAGAEAAGVRLSSWSRRFPIAGDSLSAWAGRVGPGATIAATRAYPPTAFETLAGCPFRFFLGQFARVKETERPENIIRVSAAERGNIIHRTIERFLRDVQAAGRVLEPDEAWSADDKQTLLAIADDECARAEAGGVTGSPLLWRVDRARIRRDLALFLAADTRARAETRATFIEAEHSFGDLGTEPASEQHAWPAVVVPLDGGRTIAFRGRIDRVDRSEDGTLIVYDYKSGSAGDAATIEEAADRLGAGTRLQLPLYALAARAALGEGTARVRTGYWFVSEREGFIRPGYELTAAGEEHLQGTLGVLASLVTAGTFPPVPGKAVYTSRGSVSGYDNCRNCPYDRVCLGDNRARSWLEQQQHGAEQIRGFLALSQPAGLVDDDNDATG